MNPGFRWQWPSVRRGDKTRWAHDPGHLSAITSGGVLGGQQRGGVVGGLFDQDAHFGVRGF